jgi:hypothetical protein
VEQTSDEKSVPALLRRTLLNRLYRAAADRREAVRDTSSAGYRIFEAGHTGSIPVTRSTRFRGSTNLSGPLEKVWRSLERPD